MSKKKKLLEKLMQGNSDGNFPFQDLAVVIQHMGYEYEGKSGSHRRFKLSGNPAINIQPRADGKAKEYQIKQVREILKNLKGEKS